MTSISQFVATADKQHHQHNAAQTCVDCGLNTHDGCVQLDPCGCALCKDCMILFLAQTRPMTLLACQGCAKPVEAHKIVQHGVIVQRHVYASTMRNGTAKQVQQQQSALPSTATKPQPKVTAATAAAAAEKVVTTQQQQQAPPSTATTAGQAAAAAKAKAKADRISKDAISPLIKVAAAAAATVDLTEGGGISDLGGGDADDDDNNNYGDIGFTLGEKSNALKLPVHNTKATVANGSVSSTMSSKAASALTPAATAFFLPPMTDTGKTTNRKTTTSPAKRKPTSTRAKKPAASAAKKTAPGADSTATTTPAVLGKDTQDNAAGANTPDKAEAPVDPEKEDSSSKPPAKKKAAPKRKTASASSSISEDGQPEKKKRVRKNKNPRDENAKPRRPHKTFEQRIQELLSFKEEHGHCAVPYHYDANRSLAEWVKDIRRGHMKITAEKRKRLNSIGFNWETRTNKFDREWNFRLSQLKEYKAKHGSCRVPWKYPENQSLADWINTQRKLANKNQMRSDRKKALDAIGFAWTGGGPGEPMAGSPKPPPDAAAAAPPAENNRQSPPMQLLDEEPALLLPLQPPLPPAQPATQAHHFLANHYIYQQQLQQHHQPPPPPQFHEAGAYHTQHFGHF